MKHTHINIEIANKAVLQPIEQVAQDKLGIDRASLELYGNYKAKIPVSFFQSLPQKPDGPCFGR